MFFEKIHIQYSARLRSVETNSPASGVWFLVNLVCTNLLQGPLTPEAAI